MALIICPACKAKVSQHTPACPNCGEPIKSSVEIGTGGALNLKDPVHLIAVIGLGVIVLLVILSNFL